MKNTKMNSYQKMQQLAIVAKNLVKLHQINRVKIVYKLVEKAWESGNDEMRNAITNGFLYGLTTWIDAQYPREREFIRILPPCLKQEYEKQIYSHGI
jgi:hypothetical protein